MDRNALIFADGKLGVGLGHLSRCRALQAELESLGFHTTLLDSALLNMQTLESFCLQTSSLESPKTQPAPQSDFKKPYALIAIDSYVLPLDSYFLATQYAEVCLFFDDTLRLDYPKAIVLNNAPSANVALYKEKYPHHRLFLGSEYRLLQIPFLEALKNPPPILKEKAQNVLITLGGSDLLGLNQPLITTFQRVYPHLNLHCITKDSIDFNRGVKLYWDLCAQEMVDLISQMDLCVCACGQSLGEILSCGIPVIALEVAENQRANWESFSRCVLSVPEAYLLSCDLISSQVLEHFCTLESLNIRKMHQKRALEILNRPTKWKESLESIF